LYTFPLCVYVGKKAMIDKEGDRVKDD